MYQLSRELDIRNLHENSGKLRFGSKYTASHPRANFDICARTSSKNSCKTIHRKTCYLISWICLQSFQQDCLRKHIVISNLTQTPSADSSIPKTHLPLEVHQCRFQNLRICLCSYKNNTLSYLRVKFVNFLNSRLIFNILFLNVCKQTFHVYHVHIFQKVKRVMMWNLQQIFSFAGEDIDTFSSLH